MARRSASWWREALDFYVMYLAVGAVFAPFGLVYGLLVLQGWDHWLVAIFLLGAGFLAGRYVWGKLERRLFVKAVAPVQLVSFRVSGPLLELVRPVAVATILVISVEPAMSRKPPVVVQQTQTDRSPQIAGSIETIILPV